jgi:hypothetical protein
MTCLRVGLSGVAAERLHVAGLLPPLPGLLGGALFLGLLAQLGSAHAAGGIAARLSAELGPCRRAREESAGQEGQDDR